MKPLLIVVAISTAVLVVACTTHPPLKTVQSVDLDRYYGTWYEIARLPNRFQKMCVSSAVTQRVNNRGHPA